MRKTKVTALLAVLAILIIVLAGCSGNADVVETCVLSTEQYVEKKALESAPQPESFEAGQGIYASIHFIESPLGMEYTGKWYLDGAEIKSETKAMATDRKGVIIFPLEGDKVTSGTIQFQILHGSDVLYSKEFPVL